jgi:hypothetical protein
MTSAPTRVLTRSATVAVLATGLALTSAAAGADTRYDTDRTDDVSVFLPSAETAVPAPGQVNGDVLRARLWHSSTRMGVKVVFKDLARTGALRGDFLRLVTKEGVKREVDVLAAPGSWAGRAEMDRPNGDRVRCAVAHHTDYAADVVTISVPRSCLSNPRWVRMGYGAITSPDGATMYVDDALRDGDVDPDTVTLSGRIYR